MIVLIDNYDSFTYNLVHFLGELGADVVVHRNDVVTPEQVLAMQPEAILFCLPARAIPTRLAYVSTWSRRRPGNCRCSASASAISRSPRPLARESSAPLTMMHGKVSPVSHTGDPLFAGIPSPFEATRYHSSGGRP